MTPEAAARDRDAAGRPKNARPRDGLGRPLERGAAGVPVTPDDVRLDPGAAVLTAQRLIDAGRPFHAHEVLEAVWKSAPADQRGLWQGLAQIAVGLTHARRGNSRGAVALLRRGADAIGSPAEHRAPERPDTPAGRRDTGAGRPDTRAGRRDTGAGRPDTGAGRPDSPNRGPDAAGRQPGRLPAELDLAGARQAALDLADRIDRAGLGSVTDHDLRVPLIAGA